MATTTQRVRGTTDVKKLSNSIYHSLFETGKSIVRSVGAGALNQATKGIILTINRCKEENLHVKIVDIRFVTLDNERSGKEGETISAIEHELISIEHEEKK